MKELALYWQVLHYVIDTCKMYCTKNMLFNHRTEYCQAGAITSCYAATDVCSAASSSMLNAGLSGSTVSCTPCPLQIPIASNNNTTDWADEGSENI